MKNVAIAGECDKEMYGDVPLEQCVYCGAVVPKEDVPKIDNNETWAREAERHYDGCEWIITRAHRVNL